MGRSPASRWLIRLLAVALSTAAMPLWASGQSVRAYLSSDEVGVGSQFVLSVEIDGVRQLDQEPLVPDLPFARYLGSGTSTSMQMAGGRTSVALTVQFRYQAVAQGRHTIGPVEVVAGGQTLRTQPLALTVRDAPTHNATGEGSFEDVIEPGDVFVEVEVDKRTAYENEPVVAEYRIYTRVNVESYTITGLPTATGFWTEELEQSEAPRVEQVVRNGEQYASAVVRRVALFPTGEGPMVLDPLTLEARVRVRRSRDLFGDLLDPFAPLDRSRLFGSLVPVTVETRPVTIDVRRLPARGRPESFAGHVGPLDVSTSVDRTELPPNEAVTFRISLSGAGNLRALPPPDITFPAELEVFPPEAAVEVSEGGGSIRGTRTFDYVVIPRVPGEIVLPGVEVSSFDLRDGSYRTSRAGPITLSVTGGGDGSIGTRRPSSVDAIREEIRFIHVGTPRFLRIGQSVFHRPAFWIVLLLPMVAALAALGLRSHLDRLEGDLAYARHRRAGRAARKRLSGAAKRAGGDARSFYAEVGGALSGFVADKLNLSEAGLIRERLRKLESEKGVSRETLEGVLSLLDECDRQRFAPSAGAAVEPEEVLRRARKLMTDLDRELG